MADVVRKLAWQLDQDEAHSGTVAESSDYIRLEERWGRFQLCAFHEVRTHWLRWPGPPKRKHSLIWLVSQRTSVLHPHIGSLLTYDGHLIDADFLASVYINDPGLFLHALGAGRTAVLSATIEQHISGAIHSRLLSKTKFYTLDTLESQPQAQDAILKELRSFLSIVLADLGMEMRSIAYLEFQPASHEVEIVRERQKLRRKVDALTLELQINRLEDAQIWQRAQHDFQGHLTAADRAELDALQASSLGAGLLPDFYKTKLARMEAGTSPSAAGSSSASGTAAIADEDVLDTWVLGLRVVAAAATLITSVAIILKVELFEDYNTSQLFVSGTGFGVALVTYLLARWRANVCRNRQPSVCNSSPSTSSGSSTLSTSSQQPGNMDDSAALAATQPDQDGAAANGSGNSWRLNGTVDLAVDPTVNPKVRTRSGELVEHDWAKIVLSPTHMIVAANSGSDGVVSYFMLAGEETATSTKPALAPATLMSYPSTLAGIELVGRHLLLVSTGYALCLHDLASGATSEYPIGDSFTSTGLLVKDSSVYLIVRNHPNGSFLSCFDLTTRTFMAQGLISEWVIPNPPVELGGWLYVVDSNQLHGHLYRVHTDTLRPETIYVADHKVLAPLVVDRRRDLLWICDVHGNCCAVDSRGQQAYRLALRGAARINQAPLVWADDIVLAAGCDVYWAPVAQEHFESVVNMPVPIAALFPVAPDLLAVLDRAGHLKFVTRNQDQAYSENRIRPVIYLTGHECITAAAYHPQRQQLIVALSQSGLRIVELPINQFTL